jgi:hypothetical protein
MGHEIDMSGKIEHPVAFTTEKTPWEQIQDHEYVKDRVFSDVVQYLQKDRHNAVILNIEGIHITIFRGAKGDLHNFCMIDEMCMPGEEAMGGYWAADEALRAATNPDGPYDPLTEEDDDSEDEEVEEESEEDDEDEDNDDDYNDSKDEEEEVETLAEEGEIELP